MSYPVTQQPSTDFGFATGGPKADEHIAGLESLMYKNEVKIKQIRPGCLERKLLQIFSEIEILFFFSNYSFELLGVH